MLPRLVDAGLAEPLEEKCVTKKERRGIVRFRTADRVRLIGVELVLRDSRARGMLDAWIAEHLRS